jgi:hypothetical protein
VTEVLSDPMRSSAKNRARDLRTAAPGDAEAGLLIRERPLDLVLAAFFSVSIVYGFLFSLPEALGVPVAPDSPWPPLRSLHGWAIAEEPAHLDPPPVLVASLLFDGFVQSPFLVVLVYALVRAREWIRAPALVYAGAATLNMCFYFFQTFRGPAPPPHPAVYLPFNLPWLVAPIVLGWRMWDTPWPVFHERRRNR